MASAVILINVHFSFFFEINWLFPCFCRFTLKNRNGENGDPETTEVTVYDYFVKNRNIDLKYSGNFPCINVGKPKRPTYFPLEVLATFLNCDYFPF